MAGSQGYHVPHVEDVRGAGGHLDQGAVSSIFAARHESRLQVYPDHCIEELKTKLNSRLWSRVLTLRCHASQLKFLMFLLPLSLFMGLFFSRDIPLALSFSLNDLVRADALTRCALLRPQLDRNLTAV